VLSASHGAYAAESAKVVPPKVPITQIWSDKLDAGVSAPAISDGTRAYVPLKSARLATYDIRDGHPLWTIAKNITTPLAVGDGHVYLSSGDAVEALKGEDGTSAWIQPRVTTVAPLVAAGGWVICVTNTEILALRASDGQIIWRHPAGGVRIAPAIDGDRLYAAAQDGRLLALQLATGDAAWEEFLPKGITALAAYRDHVYAGAGDKQFYVLKAKDGKQAWAPWRIGATVIGQMSVDDDRVYIAARDNVVYAYDRENGNQRWQEPLRQRPFAGVFAGGHVLFVPSTTDTLAMLFDGNGGACGTLTLPAQMVHELAPDVRETDRGPQVLVVTGGLTNEWQLTLFGPAGELPLVSVAEMLMTDVGKPLLTDPVLQPIGVVLEPLVEGDPPLADAADMKWPLVLTDPPLEPLTVVPGLQLRRLSPVLPPRRGGSQPGG
jgi:outer membrane protein assembly factor BamB